jgi:glycosidase
MGMVAVPCPPSGARFPFPLMVEDLSVRNAQSFLRILAAMQAVAFLAFVPANRAGAQTGKPVADLAPSIKATETGPNTYHVVFHYKAAGKVQGVSLAGTFNNWSTSVHPMLDRQNTGEWTTEVILGGGEHQYKFVISDGSGGMQWREDPVNSDRVSDNHGGNNSLLRLGPLAQLVKSDGVVGDGKIFLEAIEHRPEQGFYLGLDAFDAPEQGWLRLRLRALAHDIKTVGVRVRLDSDPPGKEIRGEMILAHSDAKFAYFVLPKLVPIDIDPVRNVAVLYQFILQDGETTLNWPEKPIEAGVRTNLFITPDWAKNAVWYQIMMDRFRNGDPNNDPPQTRPWRSDWFERSEHEKQFEAKGEGFYTYYVYGRRYGGDIAGVIEKIPYLKQLGVNALYFNPMFQAEAYHKYNATDYRHIDDDFGIPGSWEQVVKNEDLLDPKTWKWSETDLLFLDMVKRLRAEGFRVILDGVFNHTGTDFPAFVDARTKGPSSRFASWFNVTSWQPFQYEGWGGFGGLPAFRKTRDGFAVAQVTQHIFDVTRRWMDPNGDGDPSDGIDGWRLDVPNEVPQPFWREWMKLVRSINPNAYVSGEIWERADDWLQGDLFDAVMNYPFARACVAFFFDQAKAIDAAEFDRRLTELRMAYPMQVTLVLQNLLDSHDTDRVASMAFNPDRIYDAENRVQDNGPNYKNTRPPDSCYHVARLAALMQMTYVGAPMIWYGNEVGMWGGDDPNNRKPMLWEDLEPYDNPADNFVMKDNLTYYRKIIALRQAHPALRTGEYQTLLAEPGSSVFAFRRWNEREELIVIFNRAAARETVALGPWMPNPEQWKIMIYNADPKKVVALDKKQVLTLEPQSAAVLVRAR